MAERGRVGFAFSPGPGTGAGTTATAESPAEGAELLDDQIAAGLVPVRDKRSHKGSFGKLLVIAGSLD